MSECPDGGVRLFGQLARRGKDEDAQLTPRPSQEALEDGQEKSGGLPGAGLDQTQHIGPY